MKNFLKDTSGNVALNIALIAVPLMLSAGAVLDYSSLSQRNSTLQNAVDAALLSVSELTVNGTKAELEAEANEFLKANLTAEDYASIKSMEIVISDNRKSFTLNAVGEVETTLMRVAGINELSYTPSATIKQSNNNYEVALVLDSTYSMAAEGKMDSLKASATQFVEDLTRFNTPVERVKIGIVPFSIYVNVGTSNSGASWLDVPSPTTTNQCTTSAPVLSSSGCTTQTYYNDGEPYQAQTCSNVTYGDPVETCSDVTSSWNGCVGSRDYPLNLEDRSYSDRVPGLENVNCATPVTPLTTNKSTLLSAISGLTPQSDTYIPAGLSWGLRVLSSQSPFGGGKTYANAEATNTKKVVVLMSDGENVRSAEIPSAPTHYGTDIDQANDWTLEACDEIKSNEIIIYSIGFGSSISSETATMLKNCSTDGVNYYPAIDAGALADAFESISSKLAAVYLAD